LAARKKKKVPPWQENLLFLASTTSSFSTPTGTDAPVRPQPLRGRGKKDYFFFFLAFFLAFGAFLVAFFFATFFFAFLVAAFFFFAMLSPPFGARQIKHQSKETVSFLSIHVYRQTPEKYFIFFRFSPCVRGSSVVSTTRVSRMHFSKRQVQHRVSARLRFFQIA